MAQFPCGSVGIPFSLFKKHPFSWPEDKQLGLAQPRAPEALKKFFKLNKNFRLPPRQSNILGLDPVWGVDFPSHLKQLKDETKYMKQQFSRPWTSSNQGWRSPRNKTNTVSPLIAPAAWRDQPQTLCWEVRRSRQLEFTGQSIREETAAQRASEISEGLLSNLQLSADELIDIRKVPWGWGKNHPKGLELIIFPRLSQDQGQFLVSPARLEKPSNSWGPWVGTQKGFTSVVGNY